MEVPLYYIVKRGLSPEQLEAVMSALSITPCQAVFISNIVDSDLAWKFAPQVINAKTDSEAMTQAKHWATDIGRPMLVIGEAEFIDGIFPDGRREPLLTHA